METPLIAVRKGSVYLITTVFFVFTISLGIWITFTASERINADVNRSIEYLFLMFGIVLSLAGGIVTYLYIKRTPKIRINGVYIHFGNQTFKLDEIEEIHIIGRIRFIGFPEDGTSIIFKNSEKITFVDEMYENGWKIKTFLAMRLLNHRIETSSADSVAHSGEPLYWYKGNAVLSFRGVLLWGFILFNLYLVLFPIRPDPRTNIFLISISVFWFFLTANGMNYFGICSNHLLIKNHYFFWRKEIVPLENIYSIIRKQPYKAPQQIKIIDNYFRVKNYGAGTLTEKTWIAFLNELTEKGVGVRDELAG